MRSPPRAASLAILAVLASAAAAWFVVERKRTLDGREEHPTSIVAESAPAPQRPDLEPTAVGHERIPPAPKETGDLIEVVVTDFEDHPIAGARVGQVGAPTPFVTDSEGRCRIQLQPEVTGRLSMMIPGPTVQLSLDATGFLSTIVQLEIKSPIRAKLARVRAVRGRVLDADSRSPIAGAAVFGVYGAHDTRTTGPDGSFSIEVPSGGSPASLVVVAIGGPADVISVPVGAESCELLLQRGMEISGTVVDLTTRAPVPGVDVIDRAHGEPALTRTDAEGVFRVRVLPSSLTRRIELAVRASGYCEMSNEWTPEELTNRLPLSIDFAKTATIEGSVLDEKGKPVSGLTLMVGQNLFPSVREDCEDGPVPSRLHAALGGWENDTRTQPPFQWVRTDESGHFLASDLMPWLSCYRISSMPNQGAHVVLEGGPLCGPGDVTHVDLQASVVQVAAVKGRLLLNGHPKVGQLEWKGATQSGFAATTRDGRFELQGVEAGKVIVSTLRSTSHDATELGLGQRYEITLDPGSVLERDFDFVLAMATVSGKVATSRGTPVASAQIKLSAPGEGRLGFQASAETAADGTWSIDVPEKSTPCTVRYFESDRVETRDGVAPGTSEVDFVVAEPFRGRLQLRVVDAESRVPISELQVAWSPAGTSRWEGLALRGSSATDSAGWSTVEVTKTSVDLQVRASQDRYLSVVRKAIEVPAGDPGARIEVELSKGIGVNLRLAAGEAVPPRSTIALVLLRPEELLIAPSGVPAEDDRQVGYAQSELGPARFGEREAYVAADRPGYVACLQPGRYRLVVWGDELRIEPAEIDVLRDGATVELRWKAK